MKDLIGVGLVPATIARLGRSQAQRLQGFVEAIRERVKSAPLKHRDETGFRIRGKIQWLHIASSARSAFHRVSRRRGSLPDGAGGIVVHDHLKPYFTLQGVPHALCKARIEIEGEAWAAKRQRLLRPRPVTPPIWPASGAGR